eukprot:c952_g1_i1 orf=48-218(+)
MTPPLPSSTPYNGCGTLYMHMLKHSRGYTYIAFLVLNFHAVPWRLGPNHNEPLRKG